VRVDTARMAQPWKGPRRGFLVRWSEDDRCLVKARAEAAGLTMTDYLVQLARRDEVDENGRPRWAATLVADDQELPGLEMTA
jgi:hypothetical protein